MKKKSLLLIFSLITFIGISQQVIWLPGKGSVYGDKTQIIISPVLPHISNRFIGYDEGDIIAYPVYHLRDFNAAANYFEWETTNALYVAQLSYPGLFATDDTNTITVDFITSGGIHHQDTAEYYYSKPVLECLSVNDVPYTEDMLLVNPGSLTLSLKMYASLYTVSSVTVKGDDRIDGIYNYIDGVPAFINYPDTRYSDADHVVDISALGYGLHILEFKAFGKKEVETYPDEFSGIIRIKILIFDFIIDDDNDFSICKCDSAYFLTGKPAGGVFSGECVVESSNVLNPSLSQNSSTTVTYSYPVDNVYYSTQRTVNFDPLPVISLETITLDGFPHEVCGFEHGAIYELTGTGFTGATWSLPASSPNDIIRNFNFEGYDKVVIDWAGSGNGSIFVKAVSDKGCASQLEHFIHISYNQSPEDSAYVTLYDKMLFCSADTNRVNVFDWYGIIGGNDIFYARTEKPYYVLDFLPAPGDSFFVLTADDTTSCSTSSHIYTKPADGKSTGTDDLSGNPAIRLFPNPTNGVVNCEVLQPLSKGYLTISDVIGRQVSRINCENRVTGDIIRVETENLKSGLYYIVFSGDPKSRSYKFIVY
jgi:hypothetical protein